MQDFPSNSRLNAKASTAPREKLEPVTSGETVRRKKGLGRQFKDTFIGGSARDALGYMVEEVAIPAMRDMVHEALQAGVEQIIYGKETRPTRRRGHSSTNGLGHVSYNSILGQASKQPQPQRLSRRARARHDFDEVIIQTRPEAEDVIDRLFDLLSRDGEASVAHLYELTGVESSHTDVKWGWTDLRGAKAVPLRQGGFLLDLPEPEQLR